MPIVVHPDLTRRTGLMTETVYLRTRAEGTDFDDYGNPIPGEPTDAECAAWYEPMSSREAADRQQQQTYGYVVFLPLAADLDGADAVVIEGEEYEVIGEPQRQPSGFIVDGYQRATVQRVTG